MTREYADYLEDILEAARKAQQFVEGMTYAEFARDDKASFAAIRALEIIGEATKRVPPTIHDQYPNVPWRFMAGMRDKLIHDYSGINLKVVWKTVNEDLSALQPMIQRILKDLEE